MTQDKLIRWFAKPLMFALGLAPLGLLVWYGFTDQFSANPIEDITFETGEWTLRFLLITLAVTPLRRITGWNWLIRFRRMLGLFAFFYVVLHFIIYIWLDQSFLLGEIILDIAERPFITVGFLSFVLLIPLAATSTRGMVRRLKKRWIQLHRLVYVCAALGVLHFWWLVKADVTEPAVYALILTVLLGYRFFSPARRKLPSAGSVQSFSPAGSPTVL